MQKVPVPPVLTAAMRAPCPELPPLPEGSIATLVREAATTTLEYARCQARHRALVAAYDAARDAALAAEHD